MPVGWMAGGRKDNGNVCGDHNPPGAGAILSRRMSCKERRRGSVDARGGSGNAAHCSDSSWSAMSCANRSDG